MTSGDGLADDLIGQPELTAAVPAVTVAVDSRLSDDYLLVTPLSVSGEVAAPLSIAAGEDGASRYQFAILDGLGACEVQATSEGAAGYVPLQLPAGGDATEIVSFADSEVVHAWYATSAGLAHATRDPAGPTWIPQQGVPGTVVTSLAAVPTAVPGQWAVTALDSDGHLVLCTGENGWAPATVILSPPMVNGSARLQYASITNWVLFAADKTGPLNIWEGSQAEIVSGPTQVTLASGAIATQVLFTHAHGGTPLAVCTDQNDNLYGSVSYSDNPVMIGPAKVTQGAGMVDSLGYAHFYGADPDGGLWVLHQTGWQGYAPVWAPMFPLDTDVGQVAVPALAGAQPAVAAMRVTGGIDLLSQPGAAQMWSRVPVQAPAGTADSPAQLTRYRTRLTVSDGSGVLAPGTSLTLNPSALVALEVAGQSVVAAPDAPVTLVADGSGAVEFSQPATGLDAVTFTVTGPALPAQLTVTPHDYLASQLSGTSAIFTGSATIPAMSAATLQNATVAGDPLFPAINETQASVVAQATQSVYAVVAGTSDDTSYALDLSQPGSPVFTVNGPPPAALAGLSADFWSEIGTFFGDVLHAIKQGALTLVGWYVDVTEKVITLTVQITEDVVATLSAISLIDMAAAVSLVHGLFGWLGAPLAKVLNWLKDLLPWDDIWSNMETFNDYITGGLNFATSLLEYKAVIATGTFFADLKGTLDSHLISAAELLGSTPLRPPGNAAQSAMPPVTLPGSSTTQNWLLSKLWAAAPGGSLLIDPGDFVTTVISQVEAAVAASGIEQDAAAEVANLRRLVSAFFGDPGSLGGTVAGDLILAVKGLADVVIDSADILISIVLDLVGDAIAATLKVLDTPLGDVPLLTWLWENVLRPVGSTEQMTLGKLISLFFAIPVTLVQALAQSAAQDTGLLGAELAGISGDMDTLTFFQKSCSIMLVVVDMINDLFSATSDTSVPTIVWNWIDVAANILVNVLFWPDASIFTGDWDWDQMSAGDAVATATWCGYWVAIGIDAFFTVKETVTYIRGKGGDGGDGAGLPGAAVGENLNYWMDCAAGVVLIALGITGASLQLAEKEPGVTALDVLEGFLGPLPWASQPLLCESVVEWSYGASAAVQCLIDFFGDMDFG